MGPFDGNRRYNHFHALRNTLSQNYPGIFIPGIPPKKAVGNKDIDFVIERRYFLERFFLQLSTINYLRKVKEMEIFARPEIVGGSMDVDK
jgi:sorting nexin-1/2